MTTPPTLLGGRYEVTAPLGSGGMADVHRARDRVLSRDVAVKLLRASSDVDRERFASEALILALLSHETIVTVYDAGIDDEQPWLALELVDGTTMREAFTDGRPVEDARVLAGLGAQVASGLAHAHERGVVHRDVKPANILVTPDGRARLTDFGIARLMESGAQLTLTGTTIGTAAYLAPEQVRGEAVTGAADVYALGLVLLEALTGRRGYEGTAVEAALARLHHGPLIPTSLPTGWPGLLTAMTASDPADRPSAAVVAQRLAALADRTSAVAAALLPAVPLVAPLDAQPVDQPVEPTTEVEATRPRPRRRWRPLAAVAVLVGLALATTTLLLGADEPTLADQARGPAASSGPSTPPQSARTPSADRSRSASQPAPVVATAPVGPDRTAASKPRTGTAKTKHAASPAKGHQKKHKSQKHRKKNGGPKRR